MDQAAIDKLKAQIKGKTVVLTVGNLLKGDDGFGPSIASRLKDKIPTVIDGGISPENYIHSIIRLSPDTILVIDTTEFKGKIGEVKLFSPEEMQELGYFTTHTFPLTFILNYLQENCKNAKVLFLGIQPKKVAFGEGLSPELQATEKELSNILIQLLSGK